MEQEFNFRVVPCEYHRGYCPTICETLADAVEECDFWNEHTNFLWAIEGMNEQAEQELSDYLDKQAEEYYIESIELGLC